MRLARKVDSNQAEIIAVLLRCGCTVYPIGQPLDLLVGRAGVNYLLEIKNAAGRNRIEPGQQKFFREWNGQASIVWTLDEALRAVGLAPKLESA